MESLTKIKEFFLYCKIALEDEFLIALESNYSIVSKSTGRKLVFDLADPKSGHFVTLLNNKELGRAEILKQVSKILDTILSSENKYQSITVLVVFKYSLTLKDRDFYHSRLKPTQQFSYGIFDVDDIYKLWDKHGIEPPQLKNINDLSEKNSLSDLDLNEFDISNKTIEDEDFGSTSALRESSSIQLILENLRLNVWWLNADEQKWEYKKGKIEYYPIKTLTKNDKLRTRNYFNQLEVGDLFIAYQKAPNKHLFGVYLMVPSDSSEDFAFILLYEFINKVSWDELVNNLEFSHSTIQSMSTQGSAYKIEPELFIEILKKATDIHFFTESLAEWIGEIAKTFPESTFKNPFFDRYIDYKEDKLKRTYDKIKFQFDQVSDEDGLGHVPVAKAFANLIEKDIFTKDLKHSFVVHLQGEWGVGKSTFINLIKKELSNWVFVDYNAWQNQHIQPPWWTLINQVYIQSKTNFKGLKKCGFFIKEKIRRVKWYSSWPNIFTLAFTIVCGILLVVNFKSLSEILGNPSVSNKNNQSIGLFANTILAIGGMIGLFYSFSKLISSSIFVNSSKDAESFIIRSRDPMSQIKKHYESLVAEINKRNKDGQLAILIDDIDRCNKEYVVDLMEGLQTLFKKQKVLFIIIGDKRWISSCFQNMYNDFDSHKNNSSNMIGDLFLQKMFQLTIRVPKVSEKMREIFWHKMIGCHDDTLDELKTENELSEIDKDRLRYDLNSEKNWNDVSVINEFQEKYNLTADTVSNLVIEKMNEDSSEFVHVLKDYHSILEINPRSIKRLANNYTMIRSALIAERKSYSPDKIIRILIIDELYPFVLDWVKSLNTNEELIEKFVKKESRINEQQKFKSLIEGDADALLKTDELSIEDIKNLKGI